MNSACYTYMHTCVHINTYLHAYVCIDMKQEIMNPGGGMKGIKEGEVERGNGDAVIINVFKRHETL